MKTIIFHGFLIIFHGFPMFCHMDIAGNASQALQQHARRTLRATGAGALRVQMAALCQLHARHSLFGSRFEGKLRAICSKIVIYCSICSSGFSPNLWVFLFVVMLSRLLLPPPPAASPAHNSFLTHNLLTKLGSHTTHSHIMTY